MGSENKLYVHSTRIGKSYIQKLHFISYLNSLPPPIKLDWIIVDELLPPRNPIGSELLLNLIKRL